MQERSVCYNSYMRKQVMTQFKYKTCKNDQPEEGNDRDFWKG